MVNHVGSLFLVVVMLTGCRENPTGAPPGNPPPSSQRAVLVLNEGLFGDPTGARLSVYDFNRDSVYLDVFESVNGGDHLGSLGDDMQISDGKAYILLSGSERLIVIDAGSYTRLQTKDLARHTPHDLLIDSAHNTLYVTRLFKNSILVLDLRTLAIEDSIEVGFNPQGMVISGEHLFVCNSGYGMDRTVSVINIGSRSVEHTLTVGDGPTHAAVAPDGKIWVVCTGHQFGSPVTLGRVSIIDETSMTVVDSLDFPENLWGAINFGPDGTAYVIGTTPGSFYGGPLHAVAPASRSVVMNAIPGTFYAVAVCHDDSLIYAADVKSFTTDGEIEIYNSSGGLEKTFGTQRGPATILFKRWEVMR